MAISSNQKPFLMLKDHLRDDFSSCSSNGFNSYPRRQCCTTVRFLLDVDLKTAARYHHCHTKPIRHHQRNRKQLPKVPQVPPPLIKRNRSKIQRASDAVINAVKLLPSPSVKKKLTLPKSFSRRLFKNFWRKPDPHHDHDRESAEEIGRWGLFGEEKDKPSSDQTTITTTSRFSTSSSSENTSWSIESCSSGNDAGEGQKEFQKVNRRVVGVSVGEDSPTGKKDWANEEEKEQFSPVSVLDCPFKDEEEEDEEEIINSPFQSSLVRMEETKKKLMTKIRRFENLAQLEPVDLEKRIAIAEMQEMEEEGEEEEEEEEEESVNSPEESTLINEIKQENDEAEKWSHDLLNKLIKATTLPSSKTLMSFSAEFLLIDFFREQLEEKNVTAAAMVIKGSRNMFDEQECLQVAQSWMDGNLQEMFSDGEKDCRSVFIKDIEKHGDWTIFAEDRAEVGLELEQEIFASLLNETLLDLF